MYLYPTSKNLECLSNILSLFLATRRTLARQRYANDMGFVGKKCRYKYKSTKARIGLGTEHFGRTFFAKFGDLRELAVFALEERGCHLLWKMEGVRERGEGAQSERA